MKAKFTINEYHQVVLEYDEEYYSLHASRVMRTFTLPIGSDYVVEIFKSGDRSQVCERLYHSGHTLTCNDHQNLIDVIRREYRAMRRAEKRLAADRY